MSHAGEQPVQPPEPGARAVVVDRFHVPVALARPGRGPGDVGQERLGLRRRRAGCCSRRPLRSSARWRRRSSRRPASGHRAGSGHGHGNRGGSGSSGSPAGSCGETRRDCGRVFSRFHERSYARNAGRMRGGVSWSDGETSREDRRWDGFDDACAGHGAGQARGGGEDHAVPDLRAKPPEDAEMVTNADGRTDAPMLEGDRL